MAINITSFLFNNPRGKTTVYTIFHEKNVPYKFNLLYWASRDGNTAAFHAKCDNKGLLSYCSIVKLKNSGVDVQHDVGGWKYAGADHQVRVSFANNRLN